METTTLSDLLNYLATEYDLLAEFLTPATVTTDRVSGRVQASTPIVLGVMQTRLDIETWTRLTTARLGIQAAAQTHTALLQLRNHVRKNPAEIEPALYALLGREALTLLQRSSVFTKNRHINQVAKPTPNVCSNCLQGALWVNPNSGVLKCSTCGIETFIETGIQP